MPESRKQYGKLVEQLKKVLKAKTVYLIVVPLANPGEVISTGSVHPDDLFAIPRALRKAVDEYPGYMMALYAAKSYTKNGNGNGHSANGNGRPKADQNS